MTEPIIFSRTARGFLVIPYDKDGIDHLLESSAASSPHLWYENEHLDWDEICHRAQAGDVAFQAFVAYVETDPNPRWLDEWDSGASKHVRVEWLEHQHTYKHYYGDIVERQDSDRAKWTVYFYPKEKVITSSDPKFMVARLRQHGIWKTTLIDGCESLSIDTDFLEAVANRIEELENAVRP